ncbi:MAG: hypothetical protein Kow0075_01200 [Salibacteraceae bacterium]
MGIIRFLIIAAAIILVSRMVVRVVLPFLARYFVRKASKKAEEQMRTRQQGERIYRDGDVEIRKPRNPDQLRSDEDNFTEYEEVKDE